jgi:hypothetical protein
MTRSAAIAPTGFARCWCTIQVWRTHAMRTAGRRCTVCTADGTEMIDLLVQHHADVNARDRRGVTVLANVMASDAADLAERLRSLGAD